MIVAVYIYTNKFANNEAEQLQAIRQWLQTNNIRHTLINWYQDHELGADNYRPEFEQMQKDILSGEVSAVVVYHFNRISNSHKVGPLIIQDWLSRNVRVVSIAQDVDIKENHSSAAKLLSAIAQMQRDIHRERQAIGICAAKMQGKLKGRKKGTFKLNYKRAVLLRKRGKTLDSIAKQMGVNRSTVCRYLRHHERVEMEKAKRKWLTGQTMGTPQAQ
jgi:DNA invertase Pin-like site-specific DNA recombinase